MIPSSSPRRKSSAFPEEIRQVAAQCRHYAMCKIDYLGSGLCTSETTHYYVSHFPQERMDIYDAQARGLVPITQGLVEIASVRSSPPTSSRPACGMPWRWTGAEIRLRCPGDRLIDRARGENAIILKMT